VMATNPHTPFPSVSSVGKMAIFFTGLIPEAQPRVGPRVAIERRLDGV
jgi:hypothetical protein